jgi:hypothetical protein
MVTRRTFLTIPSGLFGASLLGGTQAAASTTHTHAMAAGSTSTGAPASGPRPPRLTWPARQVLPTFRRPKRLDVADIRPLHGADQALLATLQGVVNRTQPRLYFTFDEWSDAAWLTTFGIPTTRHEDAMSLLERYRGEISGAVVYDPDVPDTINVATTLAGLKGAVIASPDQVETYGLTVVEDLRGRFENDPIAIYRWQLEQLYPHCTHRLLTGVPPTRTVGVPGVEWREVARETREIRDSSNRDVYELDLSPELGGEAVYVRFHDAFTNDGWGPSVARMTVLADGTPIADFATNSPEEEPFLFDADGSAIAPEGHRFCDGGAYFIYRFTPPAGTTTLTARVEMWNQFLVTATTTAPTRVEPFPHFRDYIVATRAMVFWLPPNGPGGELMTEIFGTVEPTTPYLGWFSGAVAGEHSGVGLASAQGLEVLAADFYNNGTVHSGVAAPIRSAPPRRTVPPLRAKVYVTFTVGEGDNIQYCQHRMRELWDNDDRGTVPTNWTINPLLRDIGPAIYSYYQRTATENDLLIAGPSGAGYTYPGLWPADEFDLYTRMTGRYMRSTGINVISCFNIVGSGPAPVSERVGASYKKNTPALGMTLGWERGNQFSMPGGLPVVGDFARFAGVDDYYENLLAHVADWDGSAPRFVACAIQAWQWTPTQIVQLAERLDDRFELVRGDVFFALIHESVAN